MNVPAMHPVMTCAEAREFERAWFAGDSDGRRVREAMSRAGAGVAREVNALLDEAGRDRLPVVVLCGKGRNAGDALIAATRLLERTDSVVVHLAFEPGELVPEAREALDALVAAGGGRVNVSFRPDGEISFPSVTCLVLDGLVGSGFRPPMPGLMRGMVLAANKLGDALRVAVDVPSGAGDFVDDVVFDAHLTVATGIFKAPLLEPEVRRVAGRIRYVDIGFFDAVTPSSRVSVLAPVAFDSLSALRPAFCDKRDFGHVAILGGHRMMPGALLLNVLAALRAGAGLVTALCPESVHAAFAAAAPEAMWVPLPETRSGDISHDALPTVLGHLDRAHALVCGSGIGPSPEPLRLVADILERTTLPVVVDADALRRPVIDALRRRPADCGVAVLTPHAGEFRRISGHDAGECFAVLNAYARENAVVLVHKGPLPRVTDGVTGVVIPHGGPVLARGGSGDLLAGIIGALVARESASGSETVARAVAWHAAAADHVARLRGSVAVRTTDILDGLGPCLRGHR
jgi:hydroxyethylthiazole kinase-like uncharacterized protein yjeF